MHAVIMAGGSGTRFWPASRTTRPKQFLPLARGRSLIQATVDRVRDVAGPERTWIVTNPPQAERMHAILDGFPREQIILEPEARDTAPCVALAAATIEARDPGSTMAVMPADHLIEPLADFHGVLRRAASMASDDRTLVTFGVPPTHPATGFGYIELGEPIPGEADSFRVQRFREKPDLATAEEFFASGRFLWNAGIFVWNFASLTRAMRLAAPALADCTERLLAAAKAGDTDALESAFRSAPKTSVDYAVMEKADQVAVMRTGFTWEDLGSFAALDVVGVKDDHGNVTFEQDGARSHPVQSENCTIYGEGNRTVALFGVRDLVVVHTEDAILICPRDRVEHVKDVVQSLRDSDRSDLL